MNRGTRLRVLSRRAVAPPALLLLVLMLSGCPAPKETQLETVKRTGQLTLLTYAGTTTYYETPTGVAGFEYDLAKAFADDLGVKLKVLTVDRFADVLPRLLAGDADFAGANITVTDDRRTGARLTPAYQKIAQQVVYRLGSVRPAKIQDLIGREIEIQSGTNAAAVLRALKQSHPKLDWIESEDTGPEEYLQLVWEGLLDLTVANSNVVALDRQYLPELQVAFSLQNPKPVAWAFRRVKDTSLYDAAVNFLEDYRRSGALAHLIDRYYGPASHSNFINLTVFRARVRSRLPIYQQMLEAAGRKYNIDWRLLAAVAYQESYWNPKSVSHTGVRGFMMLTRITAAELGIDDRQDVEASIEGGARYLHDLLDRLPSRIQFPDRFWFALAAYNAGLYHLEDARVLTENQGGDPNKWIDVRKRLPLLADPKWYERTKYGYARGDEPVQFVRRVRTYYDVLTKIDENQKRRPTTPATKLKAPAL